MAIIAQSDQVVEKALSNSWEAGIVALIVLGCVAFLGWLFRFQTLQTQKREEIWHQQSSDREARLGERINALEDFINQKMLDRLSENTQVITQLSNAINRLVMAFATRPCMMDNGKKAEILKEAFEQATYLDGK